MNIRHTPASVAAPFGPYSHAVEVPEGSRLLYISGEVGVLPDGTVPDNIEAQAEACWQHRRRGTGNEAPSVPIRLPDHASEFPHRVASSQSRSSMASRCKRAGRDASAKLETRGDSSCTVAQ